MKQILVLGAGHSSAFLIAHLLELAEQWDWFVTVGDLDVALARSRVQNHPRGSSVYFDIDDASLRSRQIADSDVVVNMLPPSYQVLIARECVSFGRDMVSASYRAQEMRDLEVEAQRQGSLLLCELGLDPGIDHMSAMALIHRLRAAGGRITAFRSYGSGIPAPDQEHNPLRYVVTWNPRNVVQAGQAGSQYMENGRIKIVPYHEVFHHTWVTEVDGIGALEAYPNRDSLAYMEIFGLEHVETMIRGTLRYPGWSETWAQIVRLGLPNEQLRIPDLANRTYREVTEMFLPSHSRSPRIRQRLAKFLNISPTGRIMENLTWLGLCSEERIGCKGDTASAMLVHMIEQKLRMPPGGTDVVILVHELDVEYPGTNKAPESIRSTMVARGEPNGFTAMSRTVGLPVACGVKLILGKDLALRGTHLPTHPSIYTPILEELEKAGIGFIEKSVPQE